MIPETMKAVMLYKTTQNIENNLSGCFKVENVRIPTPMRGQVLIRVEFSAIHPNDLLLIQGKYAHDPTYPCALGFEGSGFIIETGGGVSTWGMKEKRVSFYAENGGAWAEFVCVDVNDTQHLSSDVSFELGAAGIINPYTAFSLLEIANAHKAKSFVLSGADSILGRMIIREGKKEGFHVVCVVKGQDEFNLCQQAGAQAENIFLLNDSNFTQKLHNKCEQLNCEFAMDCLGGENSKKLIQSMPKHSTIMVFGGLEEADLAYIPLRDILYQDKHVTGFWLQHYLKKKSYMMLSAWSRRIPSLLQSRLKSDVEQAFDMENCEEAIYHYLKQSVKGKVLLKCRDASRRKYVPAEERLEQKVERRVPEEEAPSTLVGKMRGLEERVMGSTDIHEEEQPVRKIPLTRDQRETPKAMNVVH
jgi:NADPH2:quinone reductase